VSNPNWKSKKAVSIAELGAEMGQVEREIVAECDATETELRHLRWEARITDKSFVN